MEEGKWITVKGNHILIKPGQTLHEALVEKFGEDNFDDEDEDLNVDLESISDLPTKKRTYHEWYGERNLAKELNMTDEELENITMDLINRLEDECDTVRKFDSDFNLSIYRSRFSNKYFAIKEAFDEEIKKARENVKEREFARYNEFLNKLPKNENSSIEHSTVSCNPHYEESHNAVYKSPEYIAYCWNCQRCVIAYEMRRRGYDVTASKNVKNDALKLGVNDNNLLRCFGDYESKSGGELRYRLFDTKLNGDKYSSRGALFKDAEKEMLKCGEGARFIVDWDWKNEKSGHTINAEIVNGKLIFCDSQISKQYDIKHIIDRKDIKATTFHVTRVDDLQLTDRLEGVVEWKK